MINRNRDLLLIWRRWLLIRLSPVPVAGPVRLGLVEQRDVIRSWGLQAVPHLPPWARGSPSAASSASSGTDRQPPPAAAPRPQPPRRSAQPAAAPPGRLMPAPALKRLNSSSSPAASRFAPQPPRPPSRGGRQDWPPTPRGGGVRQRAPVGSARPTAARRCSASWSPAPCALGFVAQAALAPPLTPPHRARLAAARPRSAAPGPVEGESCPPAVGRRGSGTVGSPAGCRRLAGRWSSPRSQNGGAASLLSLIHI